jgi:nucleotide-binding universal stress UspA family protein
VKILLAVDGSQCSHRAVNYLIRNASMFGAKPDVHLVHVQVKLPARAASALSYKAIQRYYDSQSSKAFASPKRALAAKKIPFREVKLWGDAGEMIAAYAKKGKFSLVVMGSRGLGGLRSLVLGSVAGKVLANCNVPALIIR